MPLAVPESLRRKPVFKEVAGANAVLTLDLPAAPMGSFDWIIAYSGSHDDATARDISIGVYDPVEDQFVEYSFNAALASGVKVGGRGLIVPSEMNLRITADALGGSNQLTIKMFRYRLDAEFLTCLLSQA